ncbi:atypical/RIO/RIO2 protein kinase [Schizosaccharomyces cryophilus OY26]|uniref:Serine/threonine-protein kinase RIO2 n=1 Tax=Schizosaccharomyces cryophilus (strain OY26 / ATCC MYA-4695 / CBS 11777 / NBRC 106824 / NRRL Y48691) TaxID=653667 RepID=S9W1A0_SCHCR|nr:atypical/RIO/RIO2 protein kinase [Schizosaccharomyces cryophilus OY26]EPY53793.1 atypical/RIO/RIO2 protein kinase [Schizosaccharomyces cryophilus OY26]
MVNLNIKSMRYLSAEDFRTLTAVEMGSRNHEVVPTSMINQIAKLRGGSCAKSLSVLYMTKLIAKMPHMSYDGYRLTSAGYDYLALKALSKRASVYSVGNQIGVGKESDVYVVSDQKGKQYILKIHRLGRTSFRSVKNNRDYLRNRKTSSWQYLSRLAATKEYTFMKILYEHGFPIPEPIDHSRHCVIMEFIDAFPLRSIEEVRDPADLYKRLIDILVRLARNGLIHGDFNEFNIIVHEDGTPVIIDFPQMVSTSHPDAKFYFERDLQCIVDYFQKHFLYEGPVPDFDEIVNMEKENSLDVHVEATGFNKKQAKELERYRKDMEESKNRGELESEDDKEQEEESSEEEEHDEE